MLDVDDVRREMVLVLQERSVKELSVPPAVLWQNIYNVFRAMHPTSALHGIPRPKGITIVKNVSARRRGGEVFRAIESATLVIRARYNISYPTVT
ncbi:hypothetical protein PHMEG_00033431 [Phytophthora megakarya]|uniref:Uncharacterized protein n=1 Tax=Phytophthora megakarya TaxID=4795 RepID=A0A225UUV7_9STRA|nr:hypothetical protein PHMEG_00033431 [Phytophthora megakarya]